MQAPCNGPDQETEAKLLEMVRNGTHPLDAYNIASEIPKASAVLGKAIQTCFLYFGSYRTINTNKCGSSCLCALLESLALKSLPCVLQPQPHCPACQWTLQAFL